MGTHFLADQRLTACSHDRQRHAFANAAYTTTNKKSGANSCEEEWVTTELECTGRGCSKGRVPTNFSKKLGKNYLANIANASFFCILCAASKIEKFDEQLQATKNSLDILGKRFATVENDQKSKQRTHSSAVAGRSETANISNLARDVHREQMAHASREWNVIISGTKFSPQEDDKALVNEIAEAIDVSLDGVQIETERLGKPSNQRMASNSFAWSEYIRGEEARIILSGAGKLARGAHENIYIRPDRAGAEQVADY